jgi:hypothetical protein
LLSDATAVAAMAERAISFVDFCSDCRRVANLLISSGR